MAIETTKVAGIGPKMAEQLEQQGITTAEQLIAAGVDKLTSVPGISQAKAEAYIAAAKALVGEAPSAAPVESKNTASPGIEPRGEVMQAAVGDSSTEGDKKSKKQKKKKEKRLKDKKIKDKKKKDRKKKKRKTKSRNANRSMELLRECLTRFLNLSTSGHKRMGPQMNANKRK